MSVEDNWQTTRPTIRERTKFMLNNNLFSDVKFVVRKSDVESEGKEVISAHKFVLSIGSPVFEPCFTVSWQRQETLLNCLTVSTRVCWSCFVTCTAMK